MSESLPRLGGALWASQEQAPGHSRKAMYLALLGALLVEGAIIFGISHMSITPPPPPPKEMRIRMAPPPPPPPPEVKKLEPPPPAPQKQPTPKPPPPAKPAAVPKPAKIAAAAHPTAHAPAIATAPADSTPSPPTAATGPAPTPEPPAPPAPAAPPAPPSLHGVVDGRGHCQSVQPVIPARALQQGISADVTAHLSINPDGSVGDVTIVRSVPPTSVFNQAVITAAKSYRCQKNGNAYVGEVTFSFKTTASGDEE